MNQREKSKNYKNVYRVVLNNRVYFEGRVYINKNLTSKLFDTELEAAKFVDLIRIKNNLPQKNNSFKKC